MRQRRFLGARVSVGAMLLFVAMGLLAGGAGPAQAAKKQRLGEFKWTPVPKLLPKLPSLRVGKIELPRDYSRPNGRTVTLVAAKVPATGVKWGTLFHNPGGPGGSGVEAIAGAVDLPASVRRHFDFVSWDPRGVGVSRPSIRGCRAATLPSSPLPATGLPTRSDWLKLLPQYRKLEQKNARQCLSRNLGIARHMGTNNVVRDLDRMRRAVGDRRLTYWGASYGSRIGYVYALRYPRRLRAILLDGSVDPRRGWREFARVRAQATDRALKVMAKPGVRPAFAAEILATRDDLRVNGPVTEDGDTLTQWVFEAFVTGKTYAQAQWTEIQELIDAIKKARAGGATREQALETIREAVEEVEEEGPFFPEIGNGRAGEAEANKSMANRIINHLDYADGNVPSGVARRILLNNVRNFPFSAANTAGLLPNSAGLGSLRPDPVPLTSAPRFARIARRSQNVLISGSTGDGATPAPWTAQMSSSFPRAGVVRFDGWQHVNWTAVESPCVNDPITRFIVTGRQPSPLRLPLCPFALPGPPAAP
ncbi:MAG: alpha/beta hydrolase [Solirubrobacterales bacterium]|nr:alpha/beta hydrolase [Solirubrobacterales bacterium]